MQMPRLLPSLPALAALLAMLACPAAPARAELPAYQIDPLHTRVVFFVGHAGFSRSIATLTGAGGELRFDPDRWEASSVQVEFAVDGLDFGDPDWNRQMVSRTFFNSRRHPVIRFTSTRVEPLDARRARIFGELELAGRRGEVVLEATLNEVGRNPMNFRRTVGFSATTTIDRREFGLGAYPNVIGDHVEVMIEFEAVRGRSRAAAQADAAHDDPEGEEEEER